jgi:hypothetical protein
MEGQASFELLTVHCHLCLFMIQLKSVLIVLVGMTMGSLVSADPSSEGNWKSLYESKVFDGMPYRLMQPLHFDGNQRYPVLISLHGAGGHGTFLWTQHDPDYFAAAAPCAGTGRTGRPEFVQP